MLNNIKIGLKKSVFLLVYLDFNQGNMYLCRDFIMEDAVIQLHQQKNGMREKKGPGEIIAGGNPG